MDCVSGKVTSFLRDEDAAGHQVRKRRITPLPAATFGRAGAAIEGAYDALLRMQAILAYLQIVKRHVPGISQFLHEAKYTYEQASQRYQVRDFESAREFGTASNSLALVIETLVSRTLREDTTYPSIVPPPPSHGEAETHSTELQEELDEVARLLARIHWVLEHGTLPVEDRTQVRRIASWSDALFAQARYVHGVGSPQDTAELLHAARHAADAAEHICRKWYVAHPAVARCADPQEQPHA